WPRDIAKWHSIPTTHSRLPSASACACWVERGVLRRLLLAFNQIQHVQGWLDAEMVGECHYFEGAWAGRKDVKLGHGSLLCCEIKIDVAWKLCGVGVTPRRPAA